MLSNRVLAHWTLGEGDRTCRVRSQALGSGEVVTVGFPQLPRRGVDQDHKVAIQFVHFLERYGCLLEGAPYADVRALQYVLTDCGFSFDGNAHIMALACGTRLGYESIFGWGLGHDRLGESEEYLPHARTAHT